MFQDNEISFSEKKFPTFKCNVTSQGPGIAIISQRQKLPFACNERRRTLPVRIAWQGAGAWRETRVSIEAKNFQCQKFLEKPKNEIISIKFQNYIYKM